MYLQGSFIFGGFNKATKHEAQKKVITNSSLNQGCQKNTSTSTSTSTSASTSASASIDIPDISDTANKRSNDEIDDIITIMFQRAYLPANLRLFGWQKNLLINSYNTIINNIFHKLVENFTPNPTGTFGASGIGTSGIGISGISSMSGTSGASRSSPVSNTPVSSTASFASSCSYSSSSSSTSRFDLQTVNSNISQKIGKIKNLLKANNSSHVKHVKLKICDIVESMELSKILAWPTGLGKTLASLAHVALIRMILDDFFAESHELKVLIIAPTGSHPVWIKEAKKFDLFHHNILTVDPNLKLRYLMFAELGLQVDGEDSEGDGDGNSDGNSDDVVKIDKTLIADKIIQDQKEHLQQKLVKLLSQEKQSQKKEQEREQEQEQGQEQEQESQESTPDSPSTRSTTVSVKTPPRITALLITSNMLLRLIGKLKTIPWDMIIRDEAHDDRCLIKCGVENLKSKDSKIAHAIYSLNHRCKLALSATLYFNSVWDVISQICMLKWTPPERQKLGENWGDIHFWKAVQPKSRLQAIAYLALKCCINQQRNLWQESKLSKISVVHKNILVQADQEQNLILLLLLRRIKVFQSNYQFCVLWNQLLDEVQRNRQQKLVASVPVSKSNEAKKIRNVTRRLKTNQKQNSNSNSKFKSSPNSRILQNSIDLSEMSLDDEIDEECENESQNKNQPESHESHESQSNQGDQGGSHRLNTEPTVPVSIQPTVKVKSSTVADLSDIASSTTATPSGTSVTSVTSSASSANSEIKLFGLWSHLQRLSLHPSLVKLQKGEENFVSKYDYCFDVDNDKDLHASPKLVNLINHILKILYEQKEKVVVCSSSVKALTYYKAYIESILEEKEAEQPQSRAQSRAQSRSQSQQSRAQSQQCHPHLARCCLYTGHETKESRANLLKRISTKNAGGVDVLFLCRAVAQSVPMTLFNHLFFLDVHPNAAQETQAFGRLARIGQRHDVIYTYQFILSFPFINKLKALISPTQFSALFSIDLYLLDIQFRKEMEARELGLGTLSANIRNINNSNNNNMLNTTNVLNSMSNGDSSHSSKPTLSPAENFALQRFAYKLKTLDHQQVQSLGLGLVRENKTEQKDQPERSESLPKLVGIKRTRTFVNESGGNSANNQNKKPKSNHRQAKSENFSFNNNNFTYSRSTKRPSARPSAQNY